jgi:hypothetical protein
MTSENLAAREVRSFAPPRPGRATWRTRVALPLFPTGIHAAVPFAIGGAWAIAIRHVNLRAMTDLGLVSVLPRATILLLLLLTLSFSLSLARRPLNPVVPLMHVVVLVVMLYGVTAILEPVPRFSTAWRLVGVTDYISGHGATNPNIDVFFNWPGFEALGAVLTKAAGYHNALAIAAWGPLVFNLLFLAPLVMIFRWASDDPRVTWLGLWIFYSTNWVAQDYLGNQAVAYMLWLTMLGATLTWFTPRPSKLAAGTPISRVARTESSTTRQGRAALLLLIVVMYAAIITGHQLTPIPAILTVSGLLLFARLQTRFLPAIMILLWAAWVTYMTTAYLAANASEYFDSIGQVSQNVNSGVSRHASAGSHGHQLIVNIRLYTTLAIWLLAAGGVLRRRMTGNTDVAMIIIAGVPFLLPALQVYGGEIVLRMFLFSLPAVAWFVATLAFPSRRAGRSWLSVAGVATIACLLVVAFQYTRYGNERLDYFTSGDYATAQTFYRLAPLGSTVYAGDENLPWRYRAYAGYKYHYITQLPVWKEGRVDAPKLALRLRSELASSGGGYIIVTRSTVNALKVWADKPHALVALVAALRVLRGHGVEQIYHNEDGDLFFVPGGERQQRQPRRLAERVAVLG